MNAQEAINTIENYMARTSSAIAWSFGVSNTDRVQREMLQAIKTLREAVEWQPMDTAPVDSPNSHKLLWRFRKHNPANYYIAGVGDAGQMYGFEAFDGWKEVE